VKVDQEFFKLFTQKFVLFCVFRNTAFCDLYFAESRFQNTVKWLLCSLIFFTLCFTIGLGPVPWILVGEFFPQEFR
jgi:hypothetical protein